MLCLLCSSSVLKPLRFLEIASFSVIIASSDSVWSKKRDHFEHAAALSVMLSLAFLPHPGFVNLQVENVTVYLANSQENVLWIQITKTLTFMVELLWLTQMQESQAFCTWWKRYLLALVSSQFRPTGNTLQSTIKFASFV